MVVIVLLVPLTALALWVEGRLFFFSCGEFEFWVGDTCSSQNSQQLLDPYSFTHILHGFLLFWLITLILKRVWPWRSQLREKRSQSLGRRTLSPAWRVAVAAVLESLWEVIENTNFVIDRYRAQTAALGYTGDTVINSIGDFSCAVAGILIARRLGWRRSLLAFLLVELVLFLWIRDSLLLQILMLIYPVNALKLLQLCR